jgi:hypothetical protein
MNRSRSPRSKKHNKKAVVTSEPTPLKLRSFKDYYIGTLLRPRRTFDALMVDDRRLKFGFYALLISLVLYLFVYIFLAMRGGAPSSFTPFLNIPKDVYYQYDRFILAPSMLGAWILAAGVGHLLSRAFSGKGSFEDTLSVFGFGIGISVLASLLHDLPDSFLGAISLLDLKWYELALNSPTIWRTILWILYSLSFILFCVLFPKGIGSAQRLGRGPAIFVGILSFIVYQGVFLIFNR